MPLSCRRGQYALEQRAREDQPEGYGHNDQKCGGAARSEPLRTSMARGAVFWPIALCGPVARTSRTSRVATPFSATGRLEKPARAGRKFVLNRHRRTNRTRFRDVSLEPYQIGMSHDTVGNIDGEVVTGIA